MLYIEEALDYTNQTVGARKKQIQRKKKVDKCPPDIDIEKEEEKEIRKNKKEEREKSLDLELQPEEDNKRIDDILDYYSSNNIDIY